MDIIYHCILLGCIWISLCILSHDIGLSNVELLPISRLQQITIFNLDLQFKINFNLIEKDLEEAILSAVEKDFLNLLPCSSEESSFISGSKLTYNLLCKENKCDFVMKKASCIFLTVLSELKNVSLICKVFPKLIFVLKSNSSMADASKCTTIISIFIEDDELLFNVMLAIVKIYVLLKDFKKIRSDVRTISEVMMLLEEDLNPHNMFIELLQKLGYDHNELLAFLTSDETCFLIYLVQYLKLLADEQHSFIFAHQNIMQCDEYSGSVISGNQTMDCSSCSESKETSLNISLVSYPVSSSSDDESDNFVHSNEKKHMLHKFVEKSVLVLKNLRIALQKLSEKKEFPYSASPLIKLLLMCEKY